MSNATVLRPRLATAGFSLVELLVALALTLIVTSAAFAVVAPSASMSLAQPSAIDMQQRGRVAADLLTHDLLVAGAGMDAGPRVGALVNFFAPVLPRRVGLQGAERSTMARADAISLIFVADTSAQTMTEQPLSPSSSFLQVRAMPNCPIGQPLCGITAGKSLVVFDTEGHFDLFTVESVTAGVGTLLARRPDAIHAYGVDAAVAEAESRTYYYDAGARQLRMYDGDQTDVPVVDHVVALSFDYFGEPMPPTKPKPPAGVENCLYDAAGTLKGGMAVLAGLSGSLTSLPLAMFTDGPWCGDGYNQFDADLLRVRSVRVTIRLEAAQATLRGGGADYVVAGTSRSGPRSVPDLTIRFSVTPRNLNLGR